jgi:hypothetical protein
VRKDASLTPVLNSCCPKDLCACQQAQRKVEVPIPIANQAVDPFDVELDGARCLASCAEGKWLWTTMSSDEPDTEQQCNELGITIWKQGLPPVRVPCKARDGSLHLVRTGSSSSSSSSSSSISM